MENNLIVQNNQPANYNRDLGGDVRRIQIKVRKVSTKDGKKKFKSIKGYMYLPVITDNVLEGKKGRWLDVHFTKDAFDDIPAEMNIHKVDDLSTGFLYVKAKGIQAPSVYRVNPKKDEQGKEMYNEDGTMILEYPSIWIKSDIMGFEAYVVNQDAFDYVAPEQVIEATDEDENVDPNTGEVFDTEPVELNK